MQDLIQNHFSFFFDGIINLITALGVLVYLFLMTFSENKKYMQKCLIFLLFLVGLICFARGMGYLFDLSNNLIFEKSIMVISSLIPFALFLLFELMLRRHFSRILKVYIVLTTILLVINFLFFDLSKNGVTALLFNYIFILSLFAFKLIKRHRSDLTSEENKLIDTVAMISVLIIPLIVTDFKSILSFGEIRLGAMGVLFFIYTLVNVWGKDNFKSNLLNLIKLVVLNLITCFIIASVFGLIPKFFYLFILFLMLRMLVSLFLDTNESYSKKSREMMLNILTHLSSPGITWSDLKNLLLTEQIFLLTKKDLSHYRHEKLLNFFKVNGVYYKNDLKSSAFTKLIQDTKDEILNLFAENECNACIFIKFNQNDFFILFFKWPAFAPQSRLTLEISILENLSKSVRVA